MSKRESVEERQTNRLRTDYEQTADQSPVTGSDPGRDVPNDLCLCPLSMQPHYTIN